MTFAEEHAELSRRLRQIEESRCAVCTHRWTRHRNTGCNDFALFSEGKGKACGCRSFVAEDELLELPLELVRDAVPEGRFGGAL